MTLNPEWLLDVSQHASADKVAAALRSATNLFRHGQCDTTADYLGTGSVPDVTIREVDPTMPAPFSSQSIKVTTDGAVANQGIVVTSNTGQAAAVGTPAAGSTYFNGTPGAQYQILSVWNNTDASVTSGTVTVFTAGTGAWPTVVDDRGVTWEIVTPPTLAVAEGFTGDAFRLRLVTYGAARAESFHVAHPMLEKGQSVVAPYVATSGGVTATRPAALPDDEIAAIVARFKSNPQDPAR